jgi:hypothetical protein
MVLRKSKNHPENHPENHRFFFWVLSQKPPQWPLHGHYLFFDMPVNSFFIVIPMGTHEVSHPKNRKEKGKKKTTGIFYAM